MIYLGIDPGADGAIAVMKDKTLLGVLDYEFVQIGGNKILDFNGMHARFDEIADHVDAVFIEQVSSRTGQGVKSMFSFGGRFAEVNSFGLTLTDNLIFLSPQNWKGQAGLIGTDKSESAKRVAKIYSNRSELFVKPNKRAKGGFKFYDGRADAVMIGLMGYKQYGDQL